MKVLFIAPLPPPVHGQSLASEIFLRSIEADHSVVVVDTAKQKHKSSIKRFLRNFEVLSFLVKIAINLPKVDSIYLTISESRAGNIKDLLTYLICFPKLRIMTIHLHGGAGMSNIMKQKPWAAINYFFIKRLNNVIVLGNSHLNIFSKIPQQRLHIVPNFSEDYLFANTKDIVKKFESTSPLNVLFLSNLLAGKGYIELLDAFLSGSDETKSMLHINFAGAFGSSESEVEFRSKIQNQKNISYHGVVRGAEKKKLFDQCHVFCLPTYYPYEGQPISILEAYASGCVVMTTDHSGIKDIFQNSSNGFEVQKRSVESILDALKLAASSRELLSIALANHTQALQNYRTSIYIASLRNILKL